MSGLHFQNNKNISSHLKIRFWYNVNGSNQWKILHTSMKTRKDSSSSSVNVEETWLDDLMAENGKSDAAGGGGGGGGGGCCLEDLGTSQHGELVHWSVRVLIEGVPYQVDTQSWRLSLKNNSMVDVKDSRNKWYPGACIVCCCVSHTRFSYT